MSKNHGITNKTKPNPKNTQVRNDINANIPQRVIFNFHYKDWLAAITLDDFTSKLKDESEFARKSFEVFSKIIPTTQKEWDEMQRRGNFTNTHRLARDRRDLVAKITKEIHGIDMDEDIDLWQIGVSQGIRLICSYVSTQNTLIPLFIDYHHQLHPSIKYNTKDLKKYNFCPYESYGK